MNYAKPATPADPHKYYGHSPNENGQGAWQSLFDHIHGATVTQTAPGVALLARDFARWFGAEDRAYLAGLLHDLGKYAPTFTAHLNGARLKLDHWTAGAYVARKKYEANDIALAIEGHHIGLHYGELTKMQEINLVAPPKACDRGLSLTETADPDAALLLKRLTDDLTAHGVTLPPFRSLPAFGDRDGCGASEMLAIRLLFSALTDADYLDTERHFAIGRKDTKGKNTPRPAPPSFDLERALEHLRVHLAERAADTAPPAELQALRRRLGEDCIAAARTDATLYTLTAPTGSGKTLAMLLFALEKMRQNPGRFRRVVVALPYLSLLDQTADIYHKLFPAKDFGEHFVLEHHSLTGARDALGTGNTSDANDAATSDVQQNEARKLTENWESPIIITTTVQLLESLHASRPAACRKLHNLAGSIILCDEVQTLPARLAIPTLRTLSALAAPAYKATVVFATATQPAFNTLHEKIAEDAGTLGWTPREIVADPETMFRRAAELRPVHADWSAAASETPWSAVADWLAGANQGMVIVNMRRHSQLLAKLLAARKTPGLEYISTYLCPAHRREVLARVRAALADETNPPCRLVATQCVEAGVDLDFPLVCRALAPLDAIAQAAGRCNRNGRAEGGGTLRVFLPEDDGKCRYPDNTYKQAADVTGNAVKSGSAPDITDPTVFANYFSDLAKLNNDIDREDAVHRAINALNFVETAKHYRLIEKSGVNVIIPYGKDGAAVWEDVYANGLNGDRIRAAREFTVSVFTDGKPENIVHLQPLTVGGKEAPDWFLLRAGEPYDPVFGLAPTDSDEPDKTNDDPAKKPARRGSGSMIA